MGRASRSILRRISKPEKINRYFDLEIKDLHRERDRESIRVDTTEGQYELIPTDRDEGFLIFLFSAQKHLQENGFDKFLPIYQSIEAYPYIKYRRQLLVLRDYVSGEKFTYTPENIIKGMETLAEFHKAARGLNPMPGSEFTVSWGKWPDRCFQEINELVKQKLLIKDKKMRDFDARFWEQVDRLIERGLMAWQRFNHENYRKVLKQEMGAKGINLHSFKAGKLQVVDGEVIIADMDRVRFELQVYDLAFFLDEILRETDLPVEEVAGFVQYYTKIRPITPEEWEAMIAFLLYPKGLYRLIRHYYRNRRVKDGLKRFDLFIDQLDREEALIDYLSNESKELVRVSESNEPSEFKGSDEINDSNDLNVEGIGDDMDD